MKANGCTLALASLEVSIIKDFPRLCAKTSASAHLKEPLLENYFWDDTEQAWSQDENADRFDESQ